MKSKILGIFAVLILLSPGVTQAFESENGTASKVSNDTWLYVNTIEFGSDDESISIPIATAQSRTPRISGEYLRYQILLGDTPYAGLEAAAMVLSDAPIVDNRYVVPAGERYSFTLVAFVTIPESSQSTQPGEGVTLSIEVTSGE